MRRLLCMVALCATLPGCAKTVWQDSTGNGRSTPELQMASANCQLYAQANTQQTDTSQCQQGKGQTGCILAGAIGNALAQGMTFNLCMQGQGWQQVKVTQVAQSQQPTLKEVVDNDDPWATAQDDDSDDDEETAMTNALFEEGKEAQRSGDYTTALELYRKAARDGDARAENNIGAFYANGFGVPRNREKALYWLHRAEKDSEGDVAKWRFIHASILKVQSSENTPKAVRLTRLAQNTRRAAAQSTASTKKKGASKTRSTTGPQ